MKVYTECGEDVKGVCDHALKKWHGNVFDLEPRIGLYFVELDVDTLERHEKKRLKMAARGIVLPPPIPLKLHGVQCAATIKANSYADRVQGKPDVTITIDRVAWESFNDEQREALLDHELEHLIPKTREGEPVSDDLGRPLFTMKPHDWDLSGFATVTRRHGKAALEVKCVVNFITSGDGQMIMDFIAPPKALTE